MNYHYVTRTWEGYKASLKLKEAAFQDLSGNSTICQENAKLICIGPIKEGESVCKGDSGSGLFFLESGYTFLIGVTSFGKL